MDNKSLLFNIPKSSLSQLLLFTSNRKEGNELNHDFCFEDFIVLSLFILEMSLFW